VRNDCTVVELSEHNEADDEEAIRRRNRSYASGVGVAQPRSELYVRSRSWKWVVPLQLLEELFGLLCEEDDLDSTLVDDQAVSIGESQIIG